MPTTTVKTIGSGRDYSTIQSWEDACPSNLVTNDEIWRGELYAEGGGTDGEWTLSSTVTISGMTTDSTRYIELTAASGESFADHADKLTNALRYNTANGVAIKANVAYMGGMFLLSGSSDIRISRLQIRAYTTSGGNIPIYSGDTAATDKNRIRDCIILQEGSQPGVSLSGARYVNLVIHRKATGRGIAMPGGNPINAINCTVYSSTGSGDAFYAAYGGSGIVKNCAAFGFGSFTNNASNWNTGSSGYNATDAASAIGSNNQTSLTASDQFESLSSGSEDLRAKDGALDGNAAREQTYTDDLDIVGQSRSTTAPTIGAWEYIAGGGGGSTFFKSIAGSITPAGALVKKTSTTRSGSSTATGALARKTLAHRVGSITLTSTLARKTSVTRTGTSTPAGAVTKKTSTSRSGSITPSGSLTNQFVLTLALAGSITIAGGIARKIGKAVVGSVTASGSITRRITRTLTGSITAAGALTRKTTRSLAGSITATGAYAASYVVRVVVSGSTTITGALSSFKFTPPTGIIDGTINFLRRYMGRR